MSRKMILFLSEFRAGAEEKEYLCPDGRTVTGLQTNEAPVRYLTRTYSDISEILCIVTPKAQATAWERFRATVQTDCPGCVLVAIPFVDGQDFTAGPLADIMSRVKKEDEILLETTGGFRSAIMHLLLLSRVLSYAGVRTISAVYSNLQEEEIQDVSHLIGLFDLVGGMQELTSFGNVRTLRAYYGKQPKDARIEALLTAVEELTEMISLCRTNQIPEQMQSFDQALREAETCGDPLMRQLLPAFRQKFGKKMTIPGLIKWCVQSDMIQQALTVYKERIPTYLLRDRADLIRVRPDAPLPEMKDYQNEDEARFYEHFLKMGRNMRTAYYGYDPDQSAGGRKDYTVTTLEHLDELLPYSYFIAGCSTDKLRTIAMDYLYIRALRNMTNHANDQATASQKQIEEYLVGCGYKRLDQVTAKDVSRAILGALEHLRSETRKERPR